MVELENGRLNPAMGLSGSKPLLVAAQNTGRFYGVYLPNSSEEDFLHVYEDKVEALKVVKHHKKARFKAFNQRSDAVAFAVHGADSSSTTSDENAPVPTSVSQSDAEKPSLFKGPKQQDMVQLRRAIESGNLELVYKTVWDNPRFLISSGDTPSILQEGSRYNALHAAAKSKNAAMTDLILQTVGDPAFSKLLYGVDEISSINKFGSPSERSAILVDLYLNTPDKGMHETPLHFAAKFGAIQVVATLVSYPQCDREPKNKFGQRPIDIVCDRCPTASEQLKSDIAALLQNDYYVPVLRADDNSLPPVIGTPYSPKDPPVLNEDPLSPRLEIHAFAGPMSQSQASEFHRLWRTPQKADKKSAVQNAPRSCPSVFRFLDTQKGLERVGRSLALDQSVPWKEYWPFLNTFVDLTSQEGLALLEEYLSKRYQSVSDLQSSKFCEDTKTTCSSDDSTDVIRVNHTLDGTDTEPEVLSPVTQLCSLMNACTILDDSMGSGLGRGSPLSLSPSPSASPSNGSFLSSVGFFDWLSKKRTETNKSESANSQNESILTALSNPSVSPFLYVEKSLQLFAKRIAASLHHTVSGNFSTHHLKESIRDVLKPEMKRVQSLVTSYMEDARFVAVDYHLVHSRIASSVAERLVDLLTWEERELFYSGLQEMLSGKGFDATLSSDDDDLVISASSYRQPRPSKQTSGPNNKTAIRCVISQMVWALDQLQGSGPDGRTTLPLRPQVRTESECLEMWSDAYPCLCSWFTNNHANFSRGSRKSSSMKRSAMNSSLNVSSESHNVSRRLDYTDKEDIGVDCGNNHVDAESHSSDDEGESFFTPPSSPPDSPVPLASESDSDDEMDVPEEGPSVFIEGNEPTRIDTDVLNAISLCDITQSSHPHIYRWRHEVLLHPSEERKRWQTQRARHADRTPSSDSIPNGMSTPTSSVKVEGSTSSWSHVPRTGFSHPYYSSPASSVKTEAPSTPSWLRITGVYSPSSSKTLKRS